MNSGKRSFGDVASGINAVGKFSSLSFLFLQLASSLINQPIDPSNYT